MNVLSPATNRRGEYGVGVDVRDVGKIGVV
jgi:hypothetical protein